MMFNYPFFSFRNRFYPYRHYDYPNFKNSYNIAYKKYENPPSNKNIEETNYTEPSSTTESELSEKRTFNKGEQFFSILGVRLYFDDLIILALLYFLYNEGVKDEGLFICLILLLLS